ncbi:MAG: CvpA family protein [Candidatus Dormibacteraceae bacterium]
MAIDIVIALVVLVAVMLGFQRGVVQPLLAEIFFFGAILILLHKRAGFSHLISLVVHTNAITEIFAGLIVAVIVGYLGGVIGGLIHRTPLVRGVDGLLGVFVHAGVAVLACYLALSVLVTLNRAFAPTLTAASLSLAQIQAMEGQLQSNPITRGLVGANEYSSLRQQAAAGHGALISQSPQLSQLQTVYQDFLQPQLVGSRLARPVLSLGQHIPMIGHVGPQDLPSRYRPPTASPSPPAVKAG